MFQQSTSHCGHLLTAVVDQPIYILASG